MALPTVADLKTWLRIETTREDLLLAALLARAQASLETMLDGPITAEVQTAVDRGAALDVPVTSLVFPRRPFTVTGIVDMDGVTVDPTTYTVDGLSGLIYAKSGVEFAAAPYTITASVGLSLRADYARIEPVIGAAILDLAADLYQRRTPGAASESAAGTSIQWDVSRDTVARVAKTVRAYRLGVAQ